MLSQKTAQKEQILGTVKQDPTQAMLQLKPIPNSIPSFFADSATTQNSIQRDRYNRLTAILVEELPMKNIVTLTVRPIGLAVAG